MRTRSLLLVTVVCLTGCTSMFFQPSTRAVLTPTRLGLTYADVWLRSADNTRVHAWWLPARNEAVATVLFLHGNAQNISTHIGSVYWLPARQVNVLLLDYRGYGQSSGTPDVGGALADIEAAVEHLLAREDMDPERLVVFGQSLGGALAVTAVAQSRHKNRIRAVIIDSAFAGFRHIARSKLEKHWLTCALQTPLTWLINDSYSPQRYASALSPVPLLVLHGDRDSVVPIEHGRQLFAAARQPKLFWPLADLEHIEALTRPDVRERFLAYLRKLLAER